jgi:hypothetical protein
MLLQKAESRGRMLEALLQERVNYIHDE